MTRPTLAEQRGHLTLGLVYAWPDDIESSPGRTQMLQRLHKNLSHASPADFTFDTQRIITLAYFDCFFALTPLVKILVRIIV